MSSAYDDLDLSSINNQIGYAILDAANDGEVVDAPSGVLADDKLELKKLWRLVLEAGAVLKSDSNSGGGKKLKKLTVKFEEGREYHITLGQGTLVYIVAKAPQSA
jgi:hypothetical protein